MRKKSTLPPNVYLKHNAYYLAVRPLNDKRKKWTRLCSAKDGEAGMYAALSENIIRGVNLPATVSFLADKYVLDEFTPKNDKESVEKAKKALADVSFKFN